jgi:two-component system cell cycle sensor histidine kinase/response regulator CckA
VVFFVFPLSVSHSQETAEKHVLILNSYSKGYVWSDNVMEGISSVLQEGLKDVDIHIEYMDTKRSADSEHLENLLRLYRHKFKNVKFDVIISSDDTAFRFLLEHRDELFPGVPYIFCGVNDFDDSMLRGQKKIAGIVETVDYTATFNLMMKLQPGLRHIFVVGSSTKTGALILKELKKIAPLYKGVLRFTFFEDYDIEELKAKLRTLNKDTAVFFINMFK